LLAVAVAATAATRVKMSLGEKDHNKENKQRPDDKRPPAADQIADIEAEIEELNRKERRLDLELKDVLTDLTTPEATDDEKEEDDDDQESARMAKQDLLASQMIPPRATDYSVLYTDNEYRSKATRKMVRMKNVVKTTANLAQILIDDRFAAELARVERVYPDDGGRDHLNRLVAIYCFQDPNDLD
jgi:seryl-tRNA synthetase